MDCSRRSALMIGALGAAAASAAGASAAPAGVQNPADPFSGPLTVLEPIGTELVMNLVVTCSTPERFGRSDQASDGKRTEIWPILGGRFWGRGGLRGTVIPGGGDFPLTRPDGVEIVDAFYRLKTDDGDQIIIHNKGIGYTEYKYRLVPEFITPRGKHDWLSRSIFLATLLDVPPALRLARGPDENDRLIQVHRVV